MNAKKWIRVWAIIIIIIIPLVGGFNYLIDPYGLYNTKYFNFVKTQQSSKMRLIKALKTKEIKPVSICLGTSRTEYGYNPTHKYFIKPSYNLAVSSASMYEEKLNFRNALKQGNLKKVLLVADYRIFNEPNQRDIPDFDSYFDSYNIYGLLFSIDVLKDSLKTIIDNAFKYKIDNLELYLPNGQHLVNFKSLKDGHFQTMKSDEKNYYKGYVTNYTYKDTGKKSFPDFEYIVKKCYENNITLDIIFGPSHIRQWEALNYYVGFDTWLKWKKDVVISVNKIARQYHKKQFRIMDFSVYYDGLTNEKVPKNPQVEMKYYRDGSHYKDTLGQIVLDRLVGDSKYKNFGVVLNLQNIDEHLKQQKINRHKFIDIKKYQMEVFGKVKSTKKVTKVLRVSHNGV